MIYVEKESIVQAVQWNGFVVSEDADWIIESFHNRRIKINFDKTINNGYVMEVNTPDGVEEAINGDYITKNKSGELRVWESNTFEEKFEKWV